MQRNHLAALLVGLTVLAIALVGAMALAGAVGADSPEQTSENQKIAVDGSGAAEAVPDKATVNVAVTATGDEPEDIRDELATDAAALEEALDEEDVEYETAHYQIREPFRDEREYDYEGAHAFDVTVEDPDDVGSIIDLATGVGAEVGNIQMTLSAETREELRDEAIENAMDDARSQADTIAATSDLTVTDVIKVDASQQRFSPVAYEMADVTDDAVDAPPTQIETDDVSVTYSVDVVFDVTS